MLATLIVVFREVLEAALVVGIVLAATRGLAGRVRWIGGGVATGLMGACLVALFAGAITDAAAGMGQELLNATILFVAVVMLTWHCVWMASHGREMARQMGDVGRDVTTGARPPYALAIVTAVAVLREGSETVLFLFGIAAGSDQGWGEMLIGGLSGLASGIGAGAALYLGLLRIPVRHLFTVTNAMVLLLAAGMAAQCAGFLVQAGYLPPLASPLWDTGWLLSESSLAGKLLHILVGYVSRPDGVQVASYVTTLIVATALMFWVRVRDSAEPRRHNAPSSNHPEHAG